MKNFDEFEKYLDEEFFMLMAKDINELKITFQLPLTQENINQFINSIAIANLSLVKSVLFEYHRWLNSEDIS